MEYGASVSPEQQSNLSLLENAIEAKTFLAYRESIPNFSKYERFYLFDKSAEFKTFLMDKKIVSDDLLSLTAQDYETFRELYDLVVDKITDKIIFGGVPFWSIKENEIRIDASLFGLTKAWEMHRDNSVSRQDFDDDYDFRHAVQRDFTNRVLVDVRKRVEEYGTDDNAQKFLREMDEDMAKRSQK